MAYSRQRERRAPPSGVGIIESMGDMSLDWDFSSAGGASMDEEDEVLASNEGSEEDRHFDSIVGALEEAVMDPTFANLQQSFIDEWCEEFEDVEENKLIYTDLFRQYTQLVEQHLDGWLRQRIRGFEMEAFMKMVAERQDEVVGDVIDILMAVGDFTEFKGMMVAHRKGRGNGLVVTTAPVAVGATGAAEETMGGRQEQAKRGDARGPSMGLSGAEGTPIRGAGLRCEASGAAATAAAESKW